MPERAEKCSRQREAAQEAELVDDNARVDGKGRQAYSLEDGVMRAGCRNGDEADGDCEVLAGDESDWSLIQKVAHQRIQFDSAETDVPQREVGVRKVERDDGDHEEHRAGRQRAR